MRSRYPRARCSLSWSGSLTSPTTSWHLGVTPSRLFVVEKVGRIRTVLNGRTLAAPFLDIASEVAPGNEPGLLSLAFSPGYARNGLFYIYFAGTDRRTHLLEFRRSASNPNKADTATRREVLSFVHLSLASTSATPAVRHPRPALPEHGRRALTGAGKMRAQRLNDPNGKILRVNPSTGRHGSSPAVCGTRGGTRSTRRPAISMSATSVSTSASRSSTHRPPRCRARTSAGPASKETCLRRRSPPACAQAASRPSTICSRGRQLRRQRR